MNTRRTVSIGLSGALAILLVCSPIASQGMDRSPQPPDPQSSQYNSEPAAGSGGNDSSQGFAPQVLSDFTLEPAAPDATYAYYNVPGSVFTPVHSAVQISYDLMGCIHATAGAGYLLNTPLLLPKGSTIKYFTLYYNDGNADDVTSWITRYPNGGASFSDLVSASSTGTSGRNSADSATITHVVDPGAANYVMNIRFNTAASNLQVCGVRVAYIPVPGCCIYVPVLGR